MPVQKIHDFKVFEMNVLRVFQNMPCLYSRLYEK